VAYIVKEGKNLTVNAASGVLSKASDPDGDLDLPLTASILAGSGPKQGSLNLQPDGSFTYAPLAGYSGADAFNFTVRDKRNGTVTRRASITVGESRPRGRCFGVGLRGGGTCRWCAVEVSTLFCN
jgi:hypothetical protein